MITRCGGPVSMMQTPSSTMAEPDASELVAKSGVIGSIARRPGAAFAAFLALHFAVWTTLPTLLYANLPLDLIEALTYGREWPLGSDKLPPLPWWMVEITYRLFGHDVFYYALAEATVVAAFALVWALARPLVGGVGALVAVLIIDGLHYFQYTAAKFNHDVVQLPLWALAGYAFHAALKRGQPRYWLLLGVAFGGALWAKYFVVVLAAAYAGFMVFDRDARRVWRTPGPWLGIAVALVIASPHLVWLVRNDFLPFAYVDARSAPASAWYDYVLHPAGFVLGQLFFLLPTLLIAAMWVWPTTTPLPLAGRNWGWGSRGAASASTNDASPLDPPPHPPPQGGRDYFTADAFDRRIVMLLAFGPAAAMVALIALSGRGAVTMWGYPLWIFVGLWIVLFAPPAHELRRLRRTVIAWAMVFVALAIAFTADYSVLPLVDHRYRAAFFPGDALADALTQRFHDATGNKKLRYVIGTMWLGGNVGHYSPDHPEVLIDGLPRRAPWIDLAELRAKGAVLVWNVGDLNHLPAPFAAIAPSAQVGTPFTLPARRFGVGVEHIGWAVLMPQ
jgi:4-amino-4-deoxy-L-arabinose transferase-like glycosyltransferase